MADITKKLWAALVALYPLAPTNDLTSIWQRHLGQEAKKDAGDTPLRDGTDIQENARNYLRDLSDV